MQRAFALGTQTIFFHAHASGYSMISEAGGHPKLTVKQLHDLPRLLGGYVEAAR